MISLKLVILFLALVGAISLGGCATRSNIQRDCKPIGDGGFYECSEYPWYLRGRCERFQ